MNAGDKTQHEISKAVGLSRALQDEGYNHVYVQKILLEKGFSPSQIRLILLKGETQVYEDRLSKNKVGMVLLGIGWAIVIAILVFSSDSPPGAPVRSTPGFLPARMVMYAAFLFVGSVIRHIYLWRKLAYLEVQLKKKF